MEISKVQLKDLIHNHLKQENGLHDVMEMVLNGLMKAERREHLDHSPANKGNGFRPGKTYGNGKILELRIPRDRNGEFYPKVLAMLRNQEQEIDRLVSALYGQGLTQQQIGEVFDEFYGHHYSTSQVSRMIDWMRDEVDEWLSRPLLERYPVVFVDAIHVKVRRETVQPEAFYVVLGVTPERKREVLAISHKPTEGAGGWEMLLEELNGRGVQDIGLIVADGLNGLDGAVAEVFPGTPMQWCVTHVERNLTNRVRPKDKQELADDLREVFRLYDPNDTPQKGWARWQQLCAKWKSKYAKFGSIQNDPAYKYCFTYLSYHWEMRSMIYTTNWIERLNRDFRRVLRMRSSMPNEESVITLLGNVAMNQKAFGRRLPHLDKEEKLFPEANEKRQ